MRLAGGRRPANWRRRARTAVLLALAPGLLGVTLMYWPPAEGLETFGLDLLFLMRGARQAPAGVRVVAIDDDSYTEFGVDPTSPWPRELHARLIRTLAREGARAVAFDVLFLEPGNPEADEALRSAIADTGIVVLGATVDQVDDPKFRRAQDVEPHAPFAAAAAALGEVNLPTHRDGVIRSVWLAPGGRPGLALAAYEVATGDTGRRATAARVIDYYGPPRTVETASVYQAVDPGRHLRPGFFKDTLVFVGLSQAAAAGPAAKDAFLTPFRGRHGAATFGVEIHATIAGNLLENRRVDLLHPGFEALGLILLPLLASLIFVYLRPLAGGGGLVVLEALPWVAGYIAFRQANVWLPMVIPAAVQLPLAYVVSLIWFYLTTVRDRERIKRAFSLYLSPEMTRQIAENPAALDLGGEEIVATAMFTDIAGFTTVAESMTARETAAMLNQYFSAATHHVFDTGGTLIKYIGDAVFAIWGAPLPMQDHAGQACIAALALSQMQGAGSDPEHPVRRLRTRIGVHTGNMVVGNLGSTQRFDYTAIGDAVNLAARLEGLNKMYGTRALLSGETVALTGDRFVVRPLGRVRVIGRAEPIVVAELLGFNGGPAPAPAGVLERFAGALADFEGGRFAAAAAGFEEALALAGGADGPSAFFRQVSRRLAENPPPTPWDGVVTAESK